MGEEQPETVGYVYDYRPYDGVLANPPQPEPHYHQLLRELRDAQELTLRQGIEILRLTHELAHLRAAPIHERETPPAFPANALKWSR